MIISKSSDIHKEASQTGSSGKSSLSQTAGGTHTIHGAIKTSKTIAAAKGAAVGGPYGAAGLALGTGRHAGKLLAAVAVLLRLPVLFVLMLPCTMSTTGDLPA